MTDTTRKIQEQGFEPLHCDIPVELTIDEYRNRRRGQAPRSESRRLPRPRLSALIRR